MAVVNPLAYSTGKAFSARRLKLLLKCQPYLSGPQRRDCWQPAVTRLHTSRGHGLKSLRFGEPLPCRLASPARQGYRGLQSDGAPGRHQQSSSSRQSDNKGWQWPLDDGPDAAQLRTTVTSFRQRLGAYLRSSFLLGYTALIDNTLVAVLEWLKADALLRRAQPRLEDAYARLFGVRHVLANGERRSFSLVNCTAPDFSVPPAYCAAAFPFGMAAGVGGYEPRTAHLLALCMRLVYEKPEVIQDLAERAWGLRFVDFFTTGKPPDDAALTSLYIDPADKAAFVPRTVAAVLATPHAVIVAFRGSEPTNLINLRSAGRISMTARRGLGRVHDGFYGALFFSGDEEAGTLFMRVLEAIKSADPHGSKALYLTGHSLGGALATIFAAALAAGDAARPALAARTHVYAFATPRVGDLAFAAAFARAYGPTAGASKESIDEAAGAGAESEESASSRQPAANKRQALKEQQADLVPNGVAAGGAAGWPEGAGHGGRAFRLGHGADIIPHVPPTWLDYVHVGEERFITTFGAVLSDPRQIKRWHTIELAGFIPLQLFKAGAGALRRDERALRTVSRLLLLVLFPGLSDHFPADYERALRAALRWPAGRAGKAGAGSTRCDIEGG